MKYVKVRFLNTKDLETSKGYTYANTVEAKKYDAVLVPTRYGFSLAVVTEVTDELCQSPWNRGEISPICEVITSKTVEAEMLVEKKKDIKKQLEAEVKKLDEVQRFELYADNNPAVAELLEEYKKLS